MEPRCVCVGGVPRMPKVKSPKTSGCRTHRHRGRSAGRRSGSRAPTEPAPGSVPQSETRLETVATGPSEAHPACPASLLSLSPRSGPAAPPVTLVSGRSLSTPGLRGSHLHLPQTHP